MVKDNRYDVAKVWYLAGKIHSFKDFFQVIPKSIIIRDLHINSTQLRRRLEKPDQWQLSKLIKLAELFEIPIDQILKLILEPTNEFIQPTSAQRHHGTESY